MEQPLDELVAPDWAEALRPVEPVIRDIGGRLRVEGKPYLPAGEHVLRAFREPMTAARALIVGQDPYPTPGHPIGLSFAVERHVRPLPRSLSNIYRELRDDLGIAPAEHGDLTAWSEQGVVLLNRVLTVAPGEPASHKGWGWEAGTHRAIEALATRGGPLVAILWGAQARSLAPLLGEIPRIESAHPSPLSASRGFFGSKPFSRTNELLAQQGAQPIDWAVS